MCNTLSPVYVTHSHQYNVIHSRQYSDVIHSHQYNDVTHSHQYNDVIHSHQYNDVTHSHQYNDVTHSIALQLLNEIWKSCVVHWVVSEVEVPNHIVDIAELDVLKTQNIVLTS